jgi:hypothetical protein
MLYRIFFPRLHHEMRGHFFRARDIVVWQARPSRSLRSDVFRALGGACPGAEISTLFGQTAAQCHIMGGSVAEFTATITNSARQTNASRAGNDRMPATIAQHEPRDERCGTW